MNKTWYINTELSQFEDRGEYNGKVPCPRKTDGRCWFWAPQAWDTNSRATWKGNKPRPECCPSSFDLKRYTTSLWGSFNSNDWDHEECFQVSAYYCIEKKKYDEDKWTPK